MNKKIVEFAEQNNLICDGLLIYGKYCGYQVNLAFGGANVAVSVVARLGDKADEFRAFLQEKKRAWKAIQVGADECNVAGIFTNLTVKSSLKKAQIMLDEIAQKLKEMQVDGEVCPYCGQPLENSVFVTDGFSKFYAHEECFNKKIQAVQLAEEEEAAKPNNFAKALLGAFLGSMIGAALFMALWFLGYFATVSALVGAVCAAKFYSKFGGKNDKIKILTVALTTLFFTVFPFFLCYVIEVSALLVQEGIVANPVFVLFELIATEGEVASAFFGDLALSVLFYVLGVGYVIYAMTRSQTKTSKKMKKLQ